MNGKSAHGPVRNALAGLAAILAALLVVAVVFSAWHQSPVVAPSSAATEIAAPSPTPSASPTLPALMPGQYVEAAARLDARTGWVYGGKLVAKGSWVAQLLMTEDGGASWRDITPPLTLSESAEQTHWDTPYIQFLDADHGWLLADVGPLMSTVDGGRTWQSTPVPAGRIQRVPGVQMSLVSPTTGYLLLGADDGQAPEQWVLYRSDDGGRSLHRVTVMPLTHPTGGNTEMTFSDELHGVVAGWGMFIYTQDGGLHWSPVSAPAMTPYWSVRALRAFGTDVVLITGERAYVSDNAGQTWRATALPQSLGGTWALADKQTWIEISSMVAPRMRETVDGGVSWTEWYGASPHGLILCSASFLDATDGWAVFGFPFVGGDFAVRAYGGELVQTTDGGRSWRGFS